MRGQEKFAGSQLRRAREQRGLTQAQAAALLKISASYYNQLEHERRPLSAAILDQVNSVFGLEFLTLTSEESGRTLAELRDALLPITTTAGPVTASDLRDFVREQPAVAAAVLQLYRRSVAVMDQLSDVVDDNRLLAPGRSPHEDVRDFFYRRRNHVAELDTAAEEAARAWGFGPTTREAQLERILAAKHGVTVRDDETGTRRRSFDPLTRELWIPAGLAPGRRAFQMATQFCFMEQGDLIERLLVSDPALDEAARPLARIGLAHYYAGALVLPYRQFLVAAQRNRYDIDQLSHQFGVSFETVCHRLSTLQRPGASGVPFFFVRTDRAGNISKRQSATTFHFSRTGGSCPLWVLYEAFDTPGRIRRQVAQLPDGRRYLWIARTVSRPALRYRSDPPLFSIGLGCDVRHADHVVYSTGLDLTTPGGAVPIGPGCKVCERTDCAQRAFPMIGRPPKADPHVTAEGPYQ